jgi:UDP-glucose 4-epimerase
MKKIIIIGGSGFIGRCLIKHLLKSGCVPTVLLRKKDMELENSGCNVIIHPEFEGLPIALSSLKYDVLINLAWRGVAGIERNKNYQLEDNLKITMWSVNLAKELQCSQWIGFGSQAEYGIQDKKLSEKDPLLATTQYGISKVASYFSSLSLCKLYGIKSTWIRLFDPYGPGDADYWFIPTIISSISSGKSPKLTSCEQMWDFIFIDDVTSGIIALINNEASGIYNIGSGSVISLKKVVEIIDDIMGNPINITFGDVPYRKDQIMHLESSIDKICAKTGWRPMVDIYTGLELTIKKASIL